jgi:hypothetical protein
VPGILELKETEGVSVRLTSAGKVTWHAEKKPRNNRGGWFMQNCRTEASGS